MTTARGLESDGGKFKGRGPTRVGRPTIKTKAILDEIYMRLCDGESLRTICRHSHMPARSVVFDWLKKDAEFRRLYELGRALQLEGLADDIIDIADDGTQDWVEREGPNGTKRLVADHDRIKRDRSRIDGRKWMLSRLLAKKYGKHALYQDIESAPPRPSDPPEAQKGKLEAALAAWIKFGAPPNATS